MSSFTSFIQYSFGSLSYSNHKRERNKGNKIGKDEVKPSLFVDDMILNIVIQPLSHVWLFATQWTEAHQASLSFTISWELWKLMSIKSVIPANHLVLWHPLLLLLLIFPSIKVFPKQSALCIRYPKYRSFSFSISLSNEYSRLLSFRIDLFDLFAAQGTLKTFLQQHSLKVWILQFAAFFMVQLSHPYMTTGKKYSFD